jgi:hypothetical protein
MLSENVLPVTAWLTVEQRDSNPPGGKLPPLSLLPQNDFPAGSALQALQSLRQQHVGRAAQA